MGINIGAAVALGAVAFAIFKPDKSSAESHREFMYGQQAGCGIKIYPNGGNRKPLHLFWEVRSCDTERTITDVGGSFSFTLLPTAAWDELIQPDDYVRIFMGDRILSSQDSAAIYNFASGQLQQSQAGGLSSPKQSQTGGVVFVPVPNSGSNIGGDTGDSRAYKTSRSQNFLAMYERAVGKIDRIERIQASPGKDKGGEVYYQVTGRMIGCILQDLSLYYNDFIPGLNAVNVFLKAQSNLVASGAVTPSDYIKTLLSITLTSVPFPQFVMPDDFINDMDFPDVRTANNEIIQTQFSNFLSARPELTGTSKTNALIQASSLADLQAAINEIESAPLNSPLSILSLSGIAETVGTMYNTSLLSSQTTGLYDLLKHMSNEFANEFWVDLCPHGDPEWGPTTSDSAVPTVVLRQRPYDIDDEMLKGSANYIQDFSKKLSKFPRQTKGDFNKSLLDIMSNGITVFGPLQNVNLSALSSTASSLSSKIGVNTSEPYIPTVLDYQVGLSSSDRLNSFLVIGAYPTGYVNYDRLTQSEGDNFYFDVDSIKRYGFRVMETSTPYAEPSEKKDQPKNWGEVSTYFSKLVSNWYFANPIFLNGRIVCRFLEDARIGIPIKYIETRVTECNPYPKLELFYCQGISDHYGIGEVLTTSLTVIRGLRYNLGASAGSVVSDQLGKLSNPLNAIASKIGFG